MSSGVHESRQLAEGAFRVSNLGVIFDIRHGDETIDLGLVPVGMFGLDGPRLG